MIREFRCPVIRTEFRTFNFFPHYDSAGGDIERDPQAVNDTPGLIRATQSKSNGAGFNTAGWIKSQLTIPPSDPGDFPEAWQGTYARVCWPDFLYFPKLDSPGNDIQQLPDKQLWELVDAARKNSKVVAFNASGWLKSSIFSISSPSNGPIATNDISPILKASLFALQATTIIWADWFIADASVRQQYKAAGKAIADEIRQKVEAGTLHWEVGAKQAIEMRNALVTSARRASSPVGLVVAEYIKPVCRPFQEFLEEYANRLYQTSYKSLTPEQAAKVCIASIDASGRPNPKFSAGMIGLGKFGRGLMVISAVMAAYSVAVAEDWKYELAKQLASWSAAISGGYLGSKHGGILFGPVGAILGGLAGGSIGGLSDEGAYSALASWFFGGNSRKSARELLGPGMDIMTEYVREHMRHSGKKYHVHQIHATHMLAMREGPDQVARVAQEMLQVPSVNQTDVEVVATIVWLMDGDEPPPANPGNPADLIMLMDWAIRNLPKWEILDNNSDTINIVAGQDFVYQMHEGGQIWRYNGSSWDRIDNNSDTAQIAAGGRKIYQQHANGQIYQYVENDWKRLADESSTVSIAAGGKELYQLKENGETWRYDKNAWKMIGGKNDVKSITASDDGNLYQMYNDGELWQYSDDKWSELDGNSDTAEVTASNGKVYQRHKNGTIYQYTDKRWVEIDKNSDTLGIAAWGVNLFQRHNNGIWRYLGAPHSWEMVSLIYDTVADIVTDGDTLYQRYGKTGQIWRFFF
ncbi:hypothetical protein F4779DRAFT_632309 [Xylariaceae sp. FL0662B]|nr:hypothetical protein F4779DRAFT_632309 [Xylariaceae sp. FL0662B]